MIFKIRRDVLAIGTMNAFRSFLDNFKRSLSLDHSANHNPPPPVNVGGEGATASSCDGDDTICHNPEHLSEWNSHEIPQYHALCSGKQCSWVVPLGGNAYLTRVPDNIPLVSGNHMITESGLTNWTSSEVKISLYFHSIQKGSFLVGLRLKVPHGSSSKILVTVSSCTKDQCQLPQSKELVLEGRNVYEIIPCGKFHAGQEGYIKMDLVGLQKTGSMFADVSHAILIPDEEHSRKKRSLEQEQVPEKSHLKFVADPQDFYFGRRGPSVHLNYDVTNMQQIEYFYNEVVVPNDQDVMGSYFCAIGFSGGYFGIQVNSPSERRVLFSIWSAYSTDNPSDIPQDFKVTMIRKGNNNVHDGEFGNEGSGAQSYLRYMWKSDTVYKFLVQAKPLDQETTMFTAWFCDTSDPYCNWQLVASFRKPKVSTYLRGLYSFSENFIPEMGHVERSAQFGNQWARDANGCWMEVTNARFSADGSVAKGTRTDVDGGVIQGGVNGRETRFYLRNCGFFSDIKSPGESFCRDGGCQCPPNIDFSSLP
ncbi:unnamed protein product [Orchesella dallaii]|uniref:DUF5077 domain-containing protein n=1 Tax=Orchesella dallaii TaxID=48710 RepID=A0ABP1REH4_9HEXA